MYDRVLNSQYQSFPNLNIQVLIFNCGFQDLLTLGLCDFWMAGVMVFWASGDMHFGTLGFVDFGNVRSICDFALFAIRSKCPNGGTTPAK